RVAGKRRRVHGWFCAERAHANARVIGERGKTRTAARVARPGERGLDEGAVRFFRIGDAEARLGDDLHAERCEQRLELTQLSRIGGGEHELLHAYMLTVRPQTPPPRPLRGSSKEKGKAITAPLLSPPRMRRGGGRRPPGWSRNRELSRNDYQNCFEILDDFAILESDQPDSGAFKEARPGGIAVLCSFMVVCRAVQLYSEPFSGTVEVQNIGANAVLTSEFPAPHT